MDHSKDAATVIIDGAPFNIWDKFGHNRLYLKLKGLVGEPLVSVVLDMSQLTNMAG